MRDGVRTTATPELSAEAIEAARQRRRVSNRLEKPLDAELSGVAVPSNHPWATSKADARTPEEVEAKRAEVRRKNAPRRVSEE